MELREVLDKLKESSDFREWFKNNSETYFSYAFTMIESNVQAEWQMGYYDKKKNKVITFIVQEKEITINPEEDIFKKPDMQVKEIDLDKVKLKLNDILANAEKLQKEKYSKELISKKIIILQNLEDFGNIWNITFLTQSFSTLNIKIKTDDGKIIEHKLAPLFGFESEK